MVSQKHTTFQESDLTFQFSQNWVIKKFDNHKYYRILSGYGLKGVDFIGILNQTTLVLIEVKNYRWRKESPKAPDISDILGNQPPLIDAFAYKIEDTILAINTVHKYLLRKWTFRLNQFIWKYVPIHWFTNGEWAFWERCHQILLNNKKEVHYVLWLNTDKQYHEMDSKQIDALQVKLQTAIDLHFSEDDAPIFVCNKFNNPYEDDLKVV